MFKAGDVPDREQAALFHDFQYHNTKYAKYAAPGGRRVPIMAAPMKPGTGVAWALHQRGLHFGEMIFFKPAGVSVDGRPEKQKYGEQTVVLDNSPATWLWVNVDSPPESPVSGRVITNSEEIADLFREYKANPDFAGFNGWFDEVFFVETDRPVLV